MRKRSAVVIATALIVLVFTATVGVPVAATEERPWTQTFSVYYWPSTMTGQVTLTGPSGSLTGSGSVNQPFLTFDYRVVSPASWGLHLYYGPLIGASGFSISSVTGNAGMWGGEVTYDWVVPLKPPAVLILEPFAGYGQQNFNQSSTTGVSGSPINLNETIGGLDVGLNAILPLSRQWFVSAGVTWYPSGFATFGFTAPAQGLSTSAVATATELHESVALTYSTPDQWHFTLGYQWAQVWINSASASITVGGGQTLGGSVCPCNFQFSGFVFGVGKSF